MAKELHPKAVTNGCSTSYAPFFCDYVIQIIRNDATFGDTAADRQALLDRGGLTIRTTLDPRIQNITQTAVNTAIPPKDPSRKIAASVVERPGTGDILAMAQNRVWGTNTKIRGETSINYMVDRKYNGTDYGIAAGSTFKAFTHGGGAGEEGGRQHAVNATVAQDVHALQELPHRAPYPPYSPRNSDRLRR